MRCLSWVLPFLGEHWLWRYGVLRHLIRVSPERLNPGGRLWLVVQRQADLGPLLKECFSTVTMAKDDGRFRVWTAH